MALSKPSPVVSPDENYRRFGAAFDTVNALVGQLADAIAGLGTKASNTQINDLSQQIYAQLGELAQGLGGKASNAQIQAFSDQVYGQIGVIAAALTGKVDNRQLNTFSAQVYAAIDQDREAAGEMIAVLKATADELSAALLPREGSRPGAAPSLFVTTLDDADLTTLPAVPETSVVSGNNGPVACIVGGGIVADRALRAVEPGRRYRARFVVQRRVNAADPSNDAVRLGLAWYDRSGARIQGDAGRTVVVEILDLTVASGRKEVQAIVARKRGDTVTHVAPYGAQFCRPYVETFGTNCQTDVEVLGWDDVSALEGISPDLTVLRSLIDGFATQDLPARTTALEQAVAAPTTLRFGTRGDAIATAIPAGIDIIETLGFSTKGDGGGAPYRRSTASATVAGKFKTLDGAYWEPAISFATAQQYGARGNGITDDAAAIQVGRQIDLLPQDYRYGADTLDTARIGRVSRQTRLRSARAGDNLLRDRSGHPIGLAFNHREELCYSGAYPRNVPAAPIVSGNLEFPPVSSAQAAGPVDIIAHWYGDWGLDWYRRATGIAGPSFDRWYDGWNRTSSPDFDPARHSILGYYRNDDPATLDWQCYWLREAGVKVVVPCAFDLDVTTWGQADNRHLWIFRLFNTKNFRGLTYIPWGRTTSFDDSNGPITASVGQITSQWQSLWFAMAAAYPNNYTMAFGGKRWFTVYCWNTLQLAVLLGGAANFAAWLKLRADEVRALGYDGLCVLSHIPDPATSANRDALIASNVLYLDSPYGGSGYSAPSSADYAGLVRTYAPPTKGALINVSTSLQSKDPISVFSYPGSTPELFAQMLERAISHVEASPQIPKAVTVYNVSEWAEGGASLHPTIGNGFDYLDAIRWASSRAARRDGVLIYALDLFANWQSLGGGNETACYWKDRSGHVHLDGLIAGGFAAADGTTILAALPPGYRPRASIIRPVTISGGTGAVSIDANGYVRAYLPLNSAQTSLAIAPFLAAA